MSVWISPRVRKHIAKHQGLQPAQEVCGIIAVRGLYVRETQSIFPLKNVASEPAMYYEVDPLKQLYYENHIEQLGGRTLGYYHTHPTTDPQPSDYDRRGWLPGMVYVIYCPVDGVFTIWKDGEQHE